MKYLQSILLILFLSGSFSANSQKKYDQKDADILENIFNQLEKDRDKSTAELVVLAGNYLKETPYLAHTLETEPEQLVINLRELDCTTYAENCLAIAQTIKSGDCSFKKFAKQLTKIRYRNGIINGYASRLHYFSDWIFENDKQGLIKAISKEIANTPYPLTINFISSHPSSYKQLKTNPESIPVLAKIEKEISSRDMFYIPKNKIAELESELNSGDIVGITTTIEGLDVTHIGILTKKNGRVYLMHASSKAEKVILSENTLQDYLLGRKSATGIMVVRPL